MKIFSSKIPRPPAPVRSLYLNSKRARLAGRLLRVLNALCTLADMAVGLLSLGFYESSFREWFLFGVLHEDCHLL